jgi:hypothetical protein
MRNGTGGLIKDLRAVWDWVFLAEGTCTCTMVRELGSYGVCRKYLA